jgi:hypothetical protein
MTLLSFQDHTLVVKAIQTHLDNLDPQDDAEECAQYHALLNWVKIQAERF